MMEVFRMIPELSPGDPSPLVGEGGSRDSARRMRGRAVNSRADFTTPHPPFGHLLPQGEKAPTELPVFAGGFA